MKKRLLAILLGVCFCVTGAQTALGVVGFSLEDAAFSELEATFRALAFSGEARQAEISDTETFLFDPTKVDRLLPNLWVTMASAPEFSEDSVALADTLGSIIGVAQYLQENFPEVFVFNTALVEAYMEEGLRYAVADESLWLWAESMWAVFVPVYIHEEATGALVEDMYLLQIVLEPGNDNTIHYILYNNPDCVAKYMEYVTVDAGASAFASNMAQWYLAKYTEQDAQEAEIPDAEPPLAGPPANSLGTALVQVGSANVRARASESSRVVAYAHKGEAYPVLAIDEDTGWYKILLEDGTVGFISPKLMHLTPEVPVF